MPCPSSNWTLKIDVYFRSASWPSSSKYAIKDLVYKGKEENNELHFHLLSAIWKSSCIARIKEYHRNSEHFPQLMCQDTISPL